MLLNKTDKARQELQARARRLSLIERRVILLADGKRSAEDLLGILGPETQSIIQQLLGHGYLSTEIGPDEGLKRSPRQTTEVFPASELREESNSSPPGAAGDAFIGRRSMATTRMFLFDICERMFSRAAPEQAAYFRSALRDARDRNSMMSVAQAMIAAIELVAGHERADSISERIAMLMPPELIEERS